MTRTRPPLLADWIDRIPPDQVECDCCLDAGCPCCIGDSYRVVVLADGSLLAVPA